MTTTDTHIEGNKLIAEFMEFDYNRSFLGLNDTIVYQSTILDCQYHSSWDWLMPVVENIESIHDDHHGRFGVHISSNNCTIQATNFRPNKPMADPPHYFDDYTFGTKIASTWNAVVQFIKWYNAQPKPTP